MRKVGAFVVMVLLGAAVAGAGLFWLGRDREPRSARGVVLHLSDNEQLAVGEMTEEALLALLSLYAEAVAEPALQPYIEPVTKGVIPGLCGRKLDLSATAAAVMLAAPDSVVPAQYVPIYPQSLYDYARYPIYQGNPARQEIALVINVAWGNENLPPMLETLRREQVRASFFLVGRWVAKNEDLVRAIAADGHEFGNHAYSDPHLPQLDREGIAREITATSEAIQRFVDAPVRFFSPPYNDFDQKVLDVASELGYLTVLCSLDTADWLRPGVDRIVRRIVPRAHNGAIVLMHPTEQTPAALEQIIVGLKEAGYRLVPVGELIAPLPGDDQIPR